jgi:hypothetical protein
MSRSRKKSPIIGVAAHSEKQWKRFANRKLRVASAVALAQSGNYDALVLPTMNEVSNENDGPKDGKRYFNVKKHPKLLRK